MFIFAGTIYALSKPIMFVGSVIRHEIEYNLEWGLNENYILIKNLRKLSLEFELLV